MSMHEIEGLVEDSVRQIASPSNRHLVYQLYQFQATYDTGYTHFRVKELLIEIGYLHYLPIQKLPGYQTGHPEIEAFVKKLEKSKSGWLSWTGAHYYGQLQDDGQTIIYFDYGSPLWTEAVQANLIDEPKATTPPSLDELSLAAQMMKAALEKGNTALVCQWYAMITNAHIEWDIANNDFLVLAADERVLAVKAMAIQAGINKYDEDWGYLKLASWKEEKDLITSNELDQYYTIRFWLDFKTDTPALIKAYHKEKKQAEKAKSDKPQKLIFIEDTFNATLVKEYEWVFQPVEKNESGDTIWQWYKDQKGKPSQFNDDYYRAFLNLELDEEEGVLVCRLGLQHGKILRWQGLKPSTAPAFWHVRQELAGIIPEDDYDRNKNLHWLGGWKLKLKNTEKTIKKRLDDGLVVFNTIAPDWFEGVAKEFSTNIPHWDKEDLLKKYERAAEGEEEMPKNAYFDMPPMYAFASLYEAIDLNDQAAIKQHTKSVVETVGNLHPKGKPKAYLAPMVEKLEKGEPVAFPYIVHLPFILHLQKQEKMK